MAPAQLKWPSGSAPLEEELPRIVMCTIPLCVSVTLTSKKGGQKYSCKYLAKRENTEFCARINSEAAAALFVCGLWFGVPAQGNESSEREMGTNRFIWVLSYVLL